MKKINLGKTWRRTFDGENVIEGQKWLRKCYSTSCNYCVTGSYKKLYSRKMRREAKRNIDNQLANYY